MTQNTSAVTTAQAQRLDATVSGLRALAEVFRFAADPDVRGASRSAYLCEFPAAPRRDPYDRARHENSQLAAVRCSEGIAGLANQKWVSSAISPASVQAVSVAGGLPPG